jgi:hypothetical protein
MLIWQSASLKSTFYSDFCFNQQFISIFAEQFCIMLSYFKIYLLKLRCYFLLKPAMI